MNRKELKGLLNTEPYHFLRTNPHLGENIILLGLGGSHAYGTNVEGSDVDVRGIALNTKEEILLGRPFEQVTDKETDTVVYSLNKAVQLLADANPNMLEILFLEPWQYAIVSPLGQELLNRRRMFLSKRVLYAFGGYARAQLNRLENATLGNLPQTEQEKHILRSIENASVKFKEKYTDFLEDGLRLYVDESARDDMDTELFMDIRLTHYPLRDYKCMWSEMHSIVKDYSKTGKRANNAITHGKVCKHAMHLVRLLLMAREALETGDMHTYCKNDHELLMSIRSGKYLEKDGVLSKEFYDMVDVLESNMKNAAEHSVLPDKPDYDSIDAYLCEANGRVVRNLLW